MDSTLTNKLADSMNPEEFDVLEYFQSGEVAHDEVSIYTHLPSARRLAALVAERNELLEQRREEARTAALRRKNSDEDPIGLDESLPGMGDDEDTEYDNEINELVERLEKTKMTFHMKSVAPSLVRAINKKYTAAKPKDLDEIAEAVYEDERTSDILCRAISKVTLADGRTDPKPWDLHRLQELEGELYREQSARLLSALYDMVYAGSYFEQALTADFS